MSQVSVVTQIYSNVLRWYWQDYLQRNELAGSKRFIIIIIIITAQSTTNTKQQKTT